MLRHAPGDVGVVAPLGRLHQQQHVVVVAATHLANESGVGGQTHVWEEGRCATFTDTIEHEAWNHSGQTRAVLIMDSWNPDLSEVERMAVADLVAAIGDFNRSVQVP